MPSQQKGSVSLLALKKYFFGSKKTIPKFIPLPYHLKLTGSNDTAQRHSP
jgi:hypothetical protein